MSDGWGRTREIWDKDLECFIEIGRGSNHEPEKRVGPNNLVRDLDPYLAVGIRDEKKGPGHSMVITGGRRQHRDELRARGMIEVGNETGTYADMPKARAVGPDVREGLARAGYYDGARSIRELRKQGR